ASGLPSQSAARCAGVAPSEDVPAMLARPPLHGDPFPTVNLKWCARGFGISRALARASPDDAHLDACRTEADVDSLTRRYLLKRAAVLVRQLCDGATSRGGEPRTDGSVVPIEVTERLQAIHLAGSVD